MVVIICSFLYSSCPLSDIRVSKSITPNYVDIFFRFYKPNEILTAEREVVPILSDDIQLSVDEYRSKLYEVCIV